MFTVRIPSPSDRAAKEPFPWTEKRGARVCHHALTEGIWLLIENPDQYALLRADPSPDMISRFVEETLRFSSPSANMFRRTTRDVTLHGVTIPANSVCFARFASANLDDTMFADAMRFDIMRDILTSNLETKTQQELLKRLMK